MQNGKHQTFRKLSNLAASLLLLGALGCGSADTAGGSAATSNGGTVAEALQAALPSVPAPPIRASASVFEPGELYQHSSYGAVWSGSNVSLDAAENGKAWCVIGLTPGSASLEQVTLRGSGSGIWLGISNYASGAWEWGSASLASDSAADLQVLDTSNPDYYSPGGSIYFTLLSTAQASLTLECQRSDAQLSISMSGPDIGNELVDLLGVNCGPYPSGEPGNPDLIEQYHNVGVSYVRTHDFYGPLDLAEMYPDRNANPTLEASFDFSESDLRWQAILDSGARPYLRLGDSWNNPTPPENPMQALRMAQACVEIVRHYMEGQWGGFNTAIDYVEIWNEPDGQFWPGHSRGEFLDFFAAVEGELHSQWPSLQVGGPGFTPAGYLSPSGQTYVTDFLGCCLANAVDLDFISWHMYSNEPDDFEAAALWYSEQLDLFGYPAAGNHITEWNTAISNDGTQTAEEIELRSGPTGAALLSAAWIKLQQAPVDVSCFYRGPDPNIDAPSFYGMWYADGTPKKIGECFALWREFSRVGTFQSLSVSGDGADGLHSLAGRDSEGDYLLLLSNTGDSELSYELSFQDFTGTYTYAIDGLYRGTLREVSATADGRTARSLPLSPISIPAHGVQLVKIDWVDSDES